MKKRKAILALVLVIALLSACQPQVVKETVVVEKSVEKVVKETVVVEKSVEKVVKETVVVEVEAAPKPPELEYKGKLRFIPIDGYFPPESLTDLQKTAGIEGNKYMAELIAQWEDLHPGIEVEIETFPEAPPGAQTAIIWYVKTAVAAGEGADVFMFYGHRTLDGEEGDKGLLVPLDTYMRMPNPYKAAGEAGSEKWVDQWYNGFDGILAQGKSIAGRYYSIPLETSAPSLMYYNKTVLDELGLEFPSPRTNITKLVDLLVKLKDAGYDPPLGIMCCSPGKNWDQLMFEHSILEPLGFEEWMLDYKVGLSHNLIEPEEFARAIKKGLFSATDERFKETLRVAKLWVPYVTEEWKTGTGALLSDFLTGKVVVRISGSWEAEPILGNPEVDFEVGVAPGPVVGPEDSPYSLEKEPGPFVGGAAGAYVVNAAAARRGTLEAAIDFLQFLTANHAYAIKGNPGQIPVIKDVEPNVRPEVAEAGMAHIPKGYMRFSTTGTIDSAATDETYAITVEYYLDRITLDEAGERLQSVWERWADRVIETNSVEAGGTWDLDKW